MQREGELAIVVAGRPTGRELCRLSLCFARVDGEPAIVVGGLQGPASIFKRDVVDATRDLYGLRPKDAALLAARALGRALGWIVFTRSRRQSRAATTTGHGEILALRCLLVGARGKPGGPFGFVFGPLEATAPSSDRRDATKAAIVARIEAFVAAHRAPPTAGPSPPRAVARSSQSAERRRLRVTLPSTSWARSEIRLPAWSKPLLRDRCRAGADEDASGGISTIMGGNRA